MYKIRTITIKDYDEIVNLWKNTEGIGSNDYDDSKKRIKIFLERNPNSCFAAECDNKIIGTILGANDGRRGIIYHLMVKPEYRKNGIAKKLLEKVEKRLKKDGIRRIYLFVLKKNKIGNKFWEDNGYVIRDFIKNRSKSLE